MGNRTRPKVEAVAICVPLRYRRAIALAALDAGKHAFIEKPLTLSLDEADQLIKRAAQSPRKVMVSFNKRWHRLVRQAREMIQRGALGPLELVVTVFTKEADIAITFQSGGSDVDWGVGC